MNRSKRLVHAGHVRVPVGVTAFWGVLPGPHVDLVESRQPVTIRVGNVVQQIAFQGRHAVRRVVGCPDVFEHDELDTDEAHRPACHRLVNERLRLLGAQHARGDARGQNQMYTHGSSIRTADAGRGYREPFLEGDVDVNVARSRATYLVDQGRRAVRLGYEGQYRKSQCRA